MLIRVCIFLCLAAPVAAHDMTPAYPEVRPSHVAGVVRADMSLFNARSDVKYYQVEVFDEAWKNIKFSSPNRIMKVDHEERKDFAVYIRKVDMARAVYLCTTSKIVKDRGDKPMVASKICSRLDGGRP